MRHYSSPGGLVLKGYSDSAAGPSEDSNLGSTAYGVDLVLGQLRPKHLSAPGQQL